MDTNNKPLALQRSPKYQVWILSYPLSHDGGDGRSYDLVGQYDTIEDAVQCSIKKSGYDPMITKTVTYKTEVIDITDLEEA